MKQRIKDALQELFLLFLLPVLLFLNLIDALSFDIIIILAQ